MARVIGGIGTSHVPTIGIKNGDGPHRIIHGNTTREELRRLLGPPNGAAERH